MLMISIGEDCQVVEGEDSRRKIQEVHQRSFYGENQSGTVITDVNLNSSFKA